MKRERLCARCYQRTRRGVPLDAKDRKAEPGGATQAVFRLNKKLAAQAKTAASRDGVPISEWYRQAVEDRLLAHSPAVASPGKAGREREPAPRWYRQLIQAGWYRDNKPRRLCLIYEGYRDEDGWEMAKPLIVYQLDDKDLWDMLSPEHRGSAVVELPKLNVGLGEYRRLKLGSAYVK